MQRLLLNVIYVWIAIFCGEAAGAGWVEISNEDGVQVFSKELESSDLVAFRGIKTFDAPIDRVAFVLLDPRTERKKEWIDMITDFRVLEQRPGYGVSYSSYDLPFPLSDRDFVVESRSRIDHSRRQFSLTLKSRQHPAAPPTIGVRGMVYSGLYRLTAVDGGRRTLVEVEVHSDPRGTLPRWLINMVQRSWPRNTLLAMEDEVSQPGTGSHAPARALIGGRAPTLRVSDP